jgi:hypothetical protein
MPKGPKLPVSKRALLARINRKLASDDTALQAMRGYPRGPGLTELKSTRGGQMRREFGDYYLLRNNVVFHYGFSLEDIARELGVLGEYERLVD